MAEKRVSKLDEIEDLVFVNTKETSYKWGGYKKELITQNLTPLEETLFVCSVCRGIMHETCSIKGGLAQVCERCIGEEVNHQPVASIRSTISKLVCKCALSERGCDWEGTLGGLVEHMEECNEFIVQCPYVKYGCKEECKRGKLEEHRREAKEYHTEVVSVFMADKVESLEKEKKEQTAKIQELESVVNEFRYLKDYIKLNGVVWTITNRHVIVNAIRQLRGEPNTGAISKFQKNSTQSGDAKFYQWNGRNALGPRFVVHSFYYLHPTLLIQNIPNASLSLQVVQQGHISIIWPLTGKCEITLVNQTDVENSWKFTKDNFQVQNGGNVNIADIPFDVLLDEKYNKDNTFVLKILIDPFCPRLEDPYLEVGPIYPLFETIGQEVPIAMPVESCMNTREYRYN